MSQHGGHFSNSTMCCSTPWVPGSVDICMSSPSPSPVSVALRILFSYLMNDERLNIGPEEIYKDDDFEFTMPGMPPKPKIPKEFEEDLGLNEVFDPSGRLYNTIAPHGEVYPLIYEYDMGDCWEHQLIFKGEKLARADRPLFSFVQGCGSVEDCHGPTGWNEIKAAFIIPEVSRTSHQKFLLKWAADVSGLGSEFDSLKERDMEKMNRASSWESRLTQYMAQSEDDDSVE